MGYQHLVGDNNFWFSTLRDKIFHHSICQSQWAILASANTVPSVPTSVGFGKALFLWIEVSIEIQFLWKNVFFSFKVWIWPSLGKDYWFKLKARTTWSNIVKKIKYAVLTGYFSEYDISYKNTICKIKFSYRSSVPHAPGKMLLIPWEGESGSGKNYIFMTE